MESKEILIAPKTDAIIPSGVVDEPSVCGAFNFITMKMIEDLGKIFQTDKSHKKYHLAIYECPFCGKHFKASIYHIRDGHTKSCGCKSKDLFSEKRKIHGLSRHPVYGAWRNMIQRCYNSKTEEFEHYGGRGITVCSLWKKDVTIFYQWAISSGYKKGLFFDRIDNDGNYEPSNCRWITTNISAENNRLIRKTNKSGYRGVMFCKKKNLKKPWRSMVQWNYIGYKLGQFATAKEAAQAYNNFVIKHKTNHPLNKI